MLLTTIRKDSEATQKEYYKYVIYSGVMSYHFFSTNKKRAYKRIIKKLGFELSESRLPEITDRCICKFFKGEITDISFTNKNQLPKGAKKIKALSNGLIVDCYFKRELGNLLFFRPNPNYKDIYKPLSLKKHIKYTSKYGTF